MYLDDASLYKKVKDLNSHFIFISIYIDNFDDFLNDIQYHENPTKLPFNCKLN